MRSLKEEVAWIILRPPAVYGPGDRDFLQVFRLLKKRIGIKIKGSLSLIFVDDLVDGILKAVNSPRAYNEVFFISHEKWYRIDEFARLSSELMGSWPPFLWISENLIKMNLIPLKLLSKTGLPVSEDKLRELRASDWVCSPQKARRLVGFRAKTDLVDGLTQTIRWYEERGLL